MTALKLKPRSPLDQNKIESNKEKKTKKCTQKPLAKASEVVCLRV